MKCIGRVFYLQVLAHVDVDSGPIVEDAAFQWAPGRWKMGTLSRAFFWLLTPYVNKKVSSRTLRLETAFPGQHAGWTASAENKGKPLRNSGGKESLQDQGSGYPQQGEAAH